METSGLREIIDAKTSEFTVWTDVYGSGMIFTRPSFGVSLGYNCMRAGIGPIQVFKSRTDLPIGAKLLASDAGFGEWTWDGVTWGLSSSPSTVLLPVTVSRDIEPTDNGRILVTTGTGITLTLKTSKIFGNFACIGYGTDTNKISFVASTGVLHNSDGNASSSGIPFKQWALTMASDGYVLGGGTSA